jgi:hypothetical protein
MSDRRLYSHLKSNELINKIDSYNLNKSKSIRPPIGILKLILINMTIGNSQVVYDSHVWNFLKDTIIDYGDTNDGLKKLSFLILKNYVSNAFKHGKEKQNFVYTGLKDELFNYLIDRFERKKDFDVLKIMGAIEIGNVGDETFKIYTNGLWKLFIQEISNDSVNYEIIHVSIRLIYKIMRDESEKEKREDKVKFVFNKLFNLLNKSDDLRTISYVCDILLELVMNDKYPFLKLQLNIEIVSKLISIVTKSRSFKEKGKIGHFYPSILSILTYYKITESDESLCKDVITCIKPFLNFKELDFSVIINSIKCIIWFSNGITNEIEDIILDIVKTFLKLFFFENSKIIKYQRTLFFDCLRNFLLIIIKFENNIIKKDPNILKDIIINYILIDEEIDFENYIIDTKLEILYLLSLKEIEDEMIIKSLIHLIKSSNDNISYKAIRTINNLIVKDVKKYSNLLDELINLVSIEKNILTVAISIKDLKDEKISKKYISYVINERDIVYESISEGSFRDDSLIAYIWILGDLYDVEELLKLQSSIWKRVKHCQYDKQISIMNIYITSLLKGWSVTGRCADKVLEILKSIVSSDDFYLPVKRHVKYYCDLISQCQGNSEVIQNILINKQIRQNKNEDENENSDLSTETVNELCHVFGSLACIYLRDINSVFRKG